MSNSTVGSIYQQIISDVCDSSRVDFEEGGVDEHVLEELRQVWQQKLTSLNVAAFPWDPKPEPIVNPPTLPSNYQAPPPDAYPSNPFPQQYQQGNVAPNSMPRIKPEPGLEPQRIMAPALPPNATAADRAVAQLNASYGPRASSSINAIQSNSGGQIQHQQQPHPGMQQQQQQPGMYNQQMPNGLSQHPNGMTQQQIMQQRAQQQRMQEAQYKQAMVNQAAQAQQKLRAQSSLNGAQTDGAGDGMNESVGIIKRFDADGGEVMGRIEIDGLIRDKIAAMGQSMEGGGLMLPLRQATSSKKRQRKAQKTTSAPGQFDGPDSDDDDKFGIKGEEVDEDAINSDLDDPDDLADGDEEDEDGNMGHIMLCMYDKVQRVKNKWKCVMKDGVLTINGKEYVFHKASGEYEW